MQLSALIDDYRACERGLVEAIDTENQNAVREFDIQMSWLRKAIREYPTVTAADRRQQIEFFLEVLAKSTEQGRRLGPLRELQYVVERAIGADDCETETAPPVANGPGAVPVSWPDHDPLATIESSNILIAVIDREARYVYASPAYARFHGWRVEAMEGRHLIDIVGPEHYEQRAKSCIDRCFTGEDICHFYSLDVDNRSLLLLECLTLARHRAGDIGSHAIIFQRDLTGMQFDLVPGVREIRV